MDAERERPGSPARIALSDDVALIRALFREYACSLGVDLSFQRFDEELAALPAGYDAVLVAHVDSEPAGCVGVRPLDSTTCEMKRLYVRPAARGAGLGRALALRAIDHARALGYERMLLDTLPTMAAARSLYRELGFVEVAPYRHNPIARTAFMALPL